MDKIKASRDFRGRIADEVKMKKSIIKEYLDAYSGGPHLVFLHGFAVGLLLFLVGITSINIFLIILGLFFAVVGPLWIKLSKKRIDYSNKKFWIVFWSDLFMAFFFYTLYIINKFELLR